MKTIKSTVWYLEMRNPALKDRQPDESSELPEYRQEGMPKPEENSQEGRLKAEDNRQVERGREAGTADPVLPEGFSVQTLHKPGVADYLKLYKSVGSSYNWCDRLLMPKEDLEKILHSGTTEVCLLKYNEESAGFVEFDKSIPGETEIVYFGLIEKFTGKKAGFPFLKWAINHALEQEIHRVWLHTCDLDHPAALPLYQKAGFVIYKTELVDQPVVER